MLSETESFHREGCSELSFSDKETRRTIIVSSKVNCEATLANSFQSLGPKRFVDGLFNHEAKLIRNGRSLT